MVSLEFLSLLLQTRKTNENQDLLLSHWTILRNFDFGVVQKCVMSGGRLPAALFLVFLLDSKGAKVCTSCRSRQERSNEYFFAKIGFDTAETGPSKACQHFANSQRKKADQPEVGAVKPFDLLKKGGAVKPRGSFDVQKSRRAAAGRAELLAKKNAH